MKSEYQYPIDLDWEIEEMVMVTDFYALIEAAYEKNVSAETLLTQYAKFKTVVKSIAHEKTIDREFERASGYSIYKAMKVAKEKKKGKFSM
ncbi:MAG: UPF0223 family protein [Streptococcaceae bacterium]|jgi:uncharacterized protein YktA (UPF0223 family)|nr:UPF0223 family protein [Streptococcaceae bacterium]